MLRERLVDVAAHTLCRRQGVGVLRMLFLKLFKLLHHHVKFTVGYFRRVKHIIIIIMAVKLVTKSLDMLFGLFAHCRK